MILATIVTSNYVYLTSSSYYKVLKCVMCVMIIVEHSKYLIAHNYKGIIRVLLDIGVMSYD